MKLLYITNIPAPYRNKRYNMMQEIFPNLGIEFEVLYMAWKEPNRLWKLDLSDFKYNYKVYRGIHPVIGNMFAHFNPGLFIRLIKGDYDVVIVGGMGSPSHWLAPFFIPTSKVKILSVESNLFSIQRKKGFALRFKQFLTRKYNVYQVTGESSKEYIQWLNEGSITKKFITLPNLIDENVFTEHVNEARKQKKYLRESMGISENTQIWICPARLEKVKGLHTFIPLLKDIKNVKLLITGDGSLKEELINTIEKYNLPIELLGFKQQEEMVNLYAIADLFVLPSFQDPSPLSPIEAIAASLPILISNRIGNCKDVLNPGKNGWVIDPSGDPNKIKVILDEISKTSLDGLEKMGIESFKQYNNKFHGLTCINAFGKQLLEAFNNIPKKL